MPGSKLVKPMDPLITWAIIALFYAPLHYLVPMLVVFLTGSEEVSALKRRLVSTAIDCTVSMTLAFALVIWLAGERMLLAMGLLLVSIAAPYVRIALHRGG